jgi:hypothetical protein
MSLFLSDPAAPGTVDPAYLDQVRELHTTVRGWIETSARAQKNAHLLANLPYVDLMFAFGFATLGDHSTANKLVEDARKVLEGPIPPCLDPEKDADPVTVRLVRDFLFKALIYRIGQAIERKPHIGPLSDAVLADFEEMRKVGGTPPIRNSHKLATYIIGRFREQLRLMEPSENVDVYAFWTKHSDAMAKEFIEWRELREPAVLAERIRKLYRNGVQGRELEEVQVHVLNEGLPLAARVGEAFTVELLEHVPAVLTAEGAPDLPRKQADLLQRALVLAGHFNREDIVKKLVDGFVMFVRTKPEGIRYNFTNRVVGRSLECFRQPNLTSELDRLLTILHNEATGGMSLVDLRKRHMPKPEVWSAVLQTLLHLAGGWMYLGRHDRAHPILQVAKNELLMPEARMFQPKDCTELARAYVSTLGTGPFEHGLPGLIELFSKMDPQKISNTWTTTQYYSRSHLLLVEDTVFAVCRLGRDNPTPAIVQT